MAVLLLAAEEDVEEVWTARYQRLDDPEYLALVIDAQTGDILLTRRATLKAAR